MRCTTQPGDTDPAYGHDWVLVPAWANGIRSGRMADAQQLLWACPCSEFKWTSYAEWELKDLHKDASPAQGFAETTNAANSEITKDNIERMTRRAYNEDES